MKTSLEKELIFFTQSKTLIKPRHFLLCKLLVAVDILKVIYDLCFGAHRGPDSCWTTAYEEFYSILWA